MAKENLNLTLEVIAVIGEEECKNDDILRLQIEQWFKDGKPIGKRKIANREYYYDRNGILRYGKTKGLDLIDLELISEKMDEIKSYLSIVEVNQYRQKQEPTELQLPIATDEAIDDIPF